MKKRIMLSIGILIMLYLAAHTASVARAQAPIRRVNVPYFDGEPYPIRMAIFWFGTVRDEDNYADVRVGYNSEYLEVRVAAFDRQLWYDPSPDMATLRDYDAATLYLDVNGAGSSSSSASTYRFDAQLSWFEERGDYQAVYRGNGSGWSPAEVAFETEASWRGEGLNDNSGAAEDRGWVLTFRIPFTSLGLSGTPSSGTTWRMALGMHDRDNSTGTPAISDKHWPDPAMDTNRPTTWGQLAFGWVEDDASIHVSSTGRTTIREGLNGAVVPDAAVGGGTTCGDGLDFWTEWGDTAAPADVYVNIQNQVDVSDWPCFSKYYVTFPLDAVPAGKAIVSATLKLHQMGNCEPSQAKKSLVQVSTVAEEWSEDTLTWNNAPLALKNVAQAWVEPMADPDNIQWPGIPWEWDVTRAVAEAHASRGPLRLVLYSADSDYHSGKYFVSSDEEEWNAEGRPTLEIVWGDPLTLDASQVRLPLITQER